MKNIYYTIAVFVVLLACKEQKTPEVKIVTDTKTETKKHDEHIVYAKAEFTIEGMSCAMGCAAAIEKNLAAMEGVKTATVNFEAKHATVEYNDNLLEMEDLVLTVTRTGDGETYTVPDMIDSGDETPEKSE